MIVESMYTIQKLRGLWWLIDEEGYEVSYVGYETKREAVEAAKVRMVEDKAKAAFIEKVYPRAEYKEDILRKFIHEARFKPSKED